MAVTRTVHFALWTFMASSFPSLRLDRGGIQPLSDSNNDEIRILKDKHNGLWKFYVLIDRDVWDRRERVKNAAAAYIGIE